MLISFHSVSRLSISWESATHLCHKDLIMHLQGIGKHGMSILYLCYIWQCSREVTVERVWEGFRYQSKRLSHADGSTCSSNIDDQRMYPQSYCVKYLVTHVVSEHVLFHCRNPIISQAMYSILCTAYSSHHAALLYHLQSNEY